ncbi:MAG: type VII secretion target [Mycobacterium sp.]|nr:type VII secretion target [Mycobacterium sp.]
MSRSLRVDTDELRDAGSAFTAAGDGLAAVRVDTPLGDAAAAIPGLRTADACDVAKNVVAKDLSAIAAAVRTYGSNLGSAAALYESTDDGSGRTIHQVVIPSTS